MATLAEHVGDELIDAELVELDEADARVSGAYLEDVRIARCALPRLALDGSELFACTFTDCDLSMLSLLDTSLREVRFVGCRLVGIDWTVAAWPSISSGDTVVFERCTLDVGTFADLDLRDTAFTGSSAREVDFADAVLSGADLSGTDLTSANFNRTDLRGADLTGATNAAIDFSSNQVAGARFDVTGALALLAPLGIEIVTEPAE